MHVLAKYSLDPKDWFYYGQWEQPPISGWFWSHWYDENIIQALGLPKLNGGILYVNGHHIVFKNDLDILKKILREACESNDRYFFDKLISGSQKLFDEHEGFVSVLERTIQPDSGVFERFISSSRKLMVPWNIGLVFSDYFGELLITSATEHGVHANDIAVAVPQPKTLMLQEHEEALAIKELSKEKNQEELDSRIDRHIKKYQWIGTHHFWGEPLNRKKFLKELSTIEVIPDRPKRERKFSSQLQFMIREAGQMTWLRQYTPEIFDVVAFAVRPLLTSIAKKFGFSYDEIIYFTPEEINLALQGKIMLTSETVERRKSGYWTLVQEGKDYFVDDQHEVQALAEVFLPKVDTKVTEFRGMVASRGQARGKAKVFLVPENLEKMQEGDIVVTLMTTPDFIPLMKRAAAIVTDVGGLLSHAALVSRELGKPCIIGTKVATKVLHDGEEVEVDAEKGVVRKIK